MAAKRGITRRQFLKAGVAAAGLAGAGLAAKLGIDASRSRRARAADLAKRFKGLRFIVSPEELARLTVQYGFTEPESLTFNLIQDNLIAKGVHLAPEKIAETLGKNPGANAQDVQNRILAVKGKVSADEIARLRRVEDVLRVAEGTEPHHQSTISTLRQKLEAYYAP